MPRVSPELRALLRITRPPPHPVSEALIEVARQFTEYPPAAGDIAGFAEDMAVVAAVWNATIAEDSLRMAQELNVVAREWQRGESFEVTQALVLLIAERRLRLYPNDLRFIAQLGVEERNGEAIVEVAHAHLTSARDSP